MTTQIFPQQTFDFGKPLDKQSLVDFVSMLQGKPTQQQFENQLQQQQVQGNLALGARHLDIEQQQTDQQGQMNQALQALQQAQLKQSADQFSKGFGLDTQKQDLEKFASQLNQRVQTQNIIASQAQMARDKAQTDLAQLQFKAQVDESNKRLALESDRDTTLTLGTMMESLKTNPEAAFAAAEALKNKSGDVGDIAKHMVDNKDSIMSMSEQARVSDLMARLPGPTAAKLTMMMTLSERGVPLTDPKFLDDIGAATQAVGQQNDTLKAQLKAAQDQTAAKKSGKPYVAPPSNLSPVSSDTTSIFSQVAAGNNAPKFYAASLRNAAGSTGKPEYGVSADGVPTASFLADNLDKGASFVFNENRSFFGNEKSLDQQQGVKFDTAEGTKSVRMPEWKATVLNKDPFAKAIYYDSHYGTATPSQSRVFSAAVDSLKLTALRNDRIKDGASKLDMQSELDSMTQKYNLAQTLTPAQYSAIKSLVNSYDPNKKNGGGYQYQELNGVKLQQLGVGPIGAGDTYNMRGLGE